MKWLAVFAALVGSAVAASPEEVAGALDFPGAVVVSGAWESSAELTHDGVDALRAVPNPAGVTDAHKLRLSATGPGYLKFWVQVPEYNPDEQARMQITSDVQSSHSLYGDGGDGWQEEIVWFPAGGHWVDVEAIAVAGFEKMAVDQVAFVASAVIPLAEAVGAPDLVWENDAALPWMGVSRDDLRVAISPLVSNGQSSRIATEASGPGIVSFGWKRGGNGSVSGQLLVNGVSQTISVGNSNTQPFSVYVPATGPVRLEWVATAGSSEPAWLEVNDVEWAPYVETSLSAALDTSPGVTWTTSPQRPFTGRPNLGAKGGTAATTEIAYQEEAWLEATVNGPGILDFNLRSSPRGLPWYSYGVVAELYVDGQKAAGLGSLWIAGAGEHRVRWVFKNTFYYGQFVAPVVDEVTWTPLVAADAEPGWTGPAGNVRAFANGGKNNAPQVVVAGGPGGQPWVERTVTGPGYLEWDAAISFSSSQSQQFMELTVDGVAPIEIEPFDDEQEWIRFRLSLPAGTHQVRWSLEGTPPVTAPGTTDFNTGMRLSGVAFTAGESPLTQAVEAPSVGWLEMGAEGSLVTGDQAGDGVDAWRIFDAEIYFLNLSAEQLKAAGKTFGNDDEGWVELRAVVPPGEAIFWAGTYAYGFGENHDPLVIDSVVAESVVKTSLVGALDLSSPPAEVVGWEGVISAGEAHDGQDAGWSALTEDNQLNRMAMTITAAAKISFYWKETGNARLGLRVNGNVILTATPEAGWKKVEVTVKAGDRVEWLHISISAYWNYRNGSAEAWVDEISVTAIDAWNLDKAATDGVVVGLTTESAAPYAWAAVELAATGGESVRGVRVVDSMAGMKATITGPAMLSFKARCFLSPAFFYPAPYGSGGGSSGSSLTIEGGGNPVPPMTELTFKIDASGAGSVYQQSDREWTSCSVFIPAGSHEISWSLNRSVSSADVRPTSSSTLVPVEAWVQEISLKRGRAFYDEWAAGRLAVDAPKSPGEDADGDGASNLAEFAYGTLPGDRGSVPAKIYGLMGPSALHPILSGNFVTAFGNAPLYSLYVPYVSPWVTAEVESSTNLQTWQAASLLIDRPPAPGVVPPLRLTGWPANTPSHQVRSFPVTTELPARYFRVRLTLSEN